MTASFTSIPSVSTEICYKTANQPWEFAAIHALNYATFVEEIPQHPANAERRLVDKFHAENTYIIAVKGRELLGMLALRRERPFSLEIRKPDLFSSLPADRQWCEIRLLAVPLAWRRHRSLIGGLFQAAIREVAAMGCDAVVISGTTRQLGLYQHLGFQPFGALVGTPGAEYQPMFGLRENLVKPELRWAAAAASVENYLPGPVTRHPLVVAAAASPDMSHRGAEFRLLFDNARRLLLGLTRAAHVQILTGSGTSANEVVAAELSKSPSTGAILATGEFGDRLVAIASRWGLCFSVVHSREEFEALCTTEPPDWLWLVHCETSTGELNELETWKSIAKSRGMRLCVDCVSSIGVVDVDLRGVWLASASSGKGLAAGAGLAMVFHAEMPAVGQTSSYLDLTSYVNQNGIPFTLNSQAVAALEASLRLTDWSAKFERVARQGHALRARLTAMGLVPSDVSTAMNPAVITVFPATSSSSLGDALKAAGIWCSYESGYLKAANAVQFCLMGEVSEANLRRLPGRLATLLAGQ